MVVQQISIYRNSKMSYNIITFSETHDEFVERVTTDINLRIEIGEIKEVISVSYVNLSTDSIDKEVAVITYK